MMKACIVLDASVKIPESQAGEMCLEPERGYTARELLIWAVATQPVFTRSMSGVLAAVRIDAACRAAKANLILDESDHKLVLEALQSPEPGFPITPPMLLAPMLESILNAQKMT